MELTIAERLMLFMALPKEGNILEIRTIRKLREALEFTEEEITQYGLVTTETEGNAQYRWNPECSLSVADIDIGEKAEDLIVDLLKKMDNNKKLSERHLTLWEKFVDGRQERYASRSAKKKGR